MSCLGGGYETSAVVDDGAESGGECCDVMLVDLVEGLLKWTNGSETCCFVVAGFGFLF